MLVWFVPFSNGLGKGHGFRGLFRNAYVIEVDGMIEPVLFGHYDNGIARDFFLNRDVNAQKEADDKKAEQDYNKCLVFLSHSLSFQWIIDTQQALNGICTICRHTLILFKGGFHLVRWMKSILFFVVCIWYRDLEKAYPFFSQYFLFLGCGQTPDVPFFGDIIMHFKCFPGKIRAYIIEILLYIIHNFFGQSRVINGFHMPFCARSGSGFHGYRREDFTDIGIVAVRTANHHFSVLFLKGLHIIEPRLKQVASGTL